MADTAKEILFSGILDAFRNGRRNPVCRIFIPGDNRMFGKLPKTLKKYIEQEWECFVSDQRDGAEKILNDDWFRRYLLYQSSISDLYDHATKNNDGSREDSKFIEMMADRAADYAEKIPDFLYSGQDADKNREDIRGNGFREERKHLTREERRVLGEFYRMGQKVICGVIQEITPKAESERIRKMTGSQEEIQEEVICNLKNGKLDNDEMWWHIRYCIAREIPGFEELMMNVAKNGQWKAWVRQAAAEYVCRFWDVEKICGEFLPGLHGKLFYWVAEQFADTRDERLKEQLANYAAYYTGQEMFQDICLVKMQDKSGLKRICSYLERMKRVKKSAEAMDPVLVIGEIYSVELLDELDRLTELLLRDDFHDRKWNGLQAALVSAFSGVAREGKQEQDQVERLLERKVNQYELRYLKKSEIKAEEKEEAAKAVAGKADKKLAMLVFMAEDVRWRSTH